MTTTLRACQTEAIACVESRYHLLGAETNLSLCTGAGKTVIIRRCSLLTGAHRVILVFPSLLLLQQYIDDKEYRTAYAGKAVYYFATEDAKRRKIPRVSDTFTELSTEKWIVLTTYVSAPRIYSNIVSVTTLPLVIHDEAHHITASLYASAFATIADKVHSINLSATLPTTKVANYKYPLLKGIHDGVVRDFNVDLFLCVDMEENTTALLKLIIRKLMSQHPVVKLLLYTREANTSGEGASSVHTFLAAHATALAAEGWWVKGIKEDTTDRDGLLREFETNGSSVSVLVSCRTLSEGIDLKGANCMVPWDPTASIVDNIQRIGRVLRLYKDGHGKIRKEQPPSTVLIPVFLPKAAFAACEGNKEAIHALLESQIGEGERGNFRPLVNVCTALKSELAEEDAELFNTLLNYPHRPKVVVNRGLMECVAKACKKPVATVVEEVAVALEGKGEEEAAEVVRGDDVEDSETDVAMDEEVAGPIVTALAETQGIQLVVRDGKETEMYGSGGRLVTVEKKVDGNYSVVKSGTKKAVADLEAAKKRVAHRMRVNFSEECQILLGLDTVEGADEMGGMVLTKLTTEVKVDEDWEKRRLEWVAMYEKLGRAPSQIGKGPGERKAAIWQTNQRQYYKRKSAFLTSERIELLEKTNGWKWKEDDPWDDMLHYWIEQYKKNNRSPKHNAVDPEEKKASKWQSHQREHYKKNDARLTSERIDILNKTPGWSWGFKQNWEELRQRWIAVYQKLGRCPSKIGKTNEERKVAAWQGVQRKNYKNKELCMTAERIAVLNSTVGWKWEEDTTWGLQHSQWVQEFKKRGHFPSNSSKDLSEKKAATWQSNQRKDYKNKEKCMTPERIAILNATPGWSWSATEAPVTPYVPEVEVSSVTDDETTSVTSYFSSVTTGGPDPIELIPAEEPSPPPVKKERKRRVGPKEPSSTPTTETHVARQRSALEEFHKRFKTMNAATYMDTIAKHPAEFSAYHDVADAYDERDPPERQPLMKIANFLAGTNKPSYSAVDLGCGRNRLRAIATVSRMNWTSVDVHGVDDTVIVADMGALPFEEESFDIAVLSRSLWARNHMDVLRETHRILKVGGRAVICESFRRWLSEDGKNTLLACLCEVGFTVIQEEGTTDSDATDDVFQYIIVRK